MKLTKRNLKQLIEAFISGPEGTINLDAEPYEFMKNHPDPKIADFASASPESAKQAALLSDREEDYEKAEFNFNKSLELNQKIGDAVGIGLCKQNLGSSAINRRDLDTAEKLLMESKKILEENNSEHLQGTLRGLDMIRQLRGF